MRGRFNSESPIDFKTTDLDKRTMEFDLWPESVKDWQEIEQGCVAWVVEPRLDGDRIVWESNSSNWGISTPGRGDIQ